MNISYYEKDGRIGVKYRPPFEDNLEKYRPYAIDLMGELDAGLIPKKIQQAGKQAIAAHAKQLCQKDLKKRQQAVRDKIKTRKEHIDAMNIPITTQHTSGTILQGRIIKNPEGYGILVTLESPFKSQKGYVFNYPNCFAEAMGGAKVYQDDGTLTQRAENDARDAVVKLYEYGVRRQKHGKVLDVVESLNSAASCED